MLSHTRIRIGGEGKIRPMVGQQLYRSRLRSTTEAREKDSYLLTNSSGIIFFTSCSLTSFPHCGLGHYRGRRQDILLYFCWFGGGGGAYRDRELFGSYPHLQVRMDAASNKTNKINLNGNEM